MSLQSWKDVFYSTEAEKFKGLKQTPKNELKAVNHCIRKWEGLSEGNLEGHDLDFDFYFNKVLSYGDEVLNIDATSCALCMLHCLYCDDCILYKLGYYCESGTSPYKKLWSEGPQPMIDALNECKQELENKIGTKQAY